MSHLQPAPDDIRDIAADWFARRRSGAFTGRDQAELDAWLDADPEHAQAYAAIERAWSGAAAVRADPRVMARRQALLKARGRRAFAVRALAASLVVALLGGGVAGVQVLTGPKPLATQAFRTAVGQRATVTLPDGSVVTLNTDTVVRTRADHDRRLVYLDKGQAFFKVAHDKRHPFVVAAAGRTVTALGTAFDVRVDHGALRVVLVEGKVRVETPAAPAAPAGKAAPQTPAPARPAPGQATEMVAGSELVAPDDADWRLTRADAVRETSWTRGQIIFDNQPLGAVVDELNRYSDQKMVVAGAKLAATPISGTFKPGDLHGFAVALENYRLARVENESEREVRIVAY
ncbi:MAG: FecR family protein [Parcubacteria group bacterium]